MKLPYCMILDFLDLKESAKETADILTMLGFEVEDVAEVNGEAVFDIKVCSNRGDGLSALGLARELSAKLPNVPRTSLFERAITGFASKGQVTQKQPQVGIKIQSTACSHFAIREYSNVTNSQSSSAIQSRLALAGQRSISLLVDLTNYVMLELGQPLHAYDKAKLKGQSLIIREAEAGEVVTTLDGVNRPLTAGQLMICDESGPIGVAGVMGGLSTEVSEETSEVVLESANFRNISVRKTRKQLGLSTEASYRFERSVDPNGVVPALNRFSELLVEGGFHFESTEVLDDYPAPPTPSPIKFDPERCSVLLGFETPKNACSEILTRLGCHVSESGECLQAVPPSWRPDLVQFEDLVEDIGRVSGYENIPEALPTGTTSQGGVRGPLRSVDNAVDKLLLAGYSQIASHSLRAKSGLDNPELDSIPIKNPSSPDTAWLRNSVLGGLVDALKRNGPEYGHYFELGPVFYKQTQSWVTSKGFGLLSAGPLELPMIKGESIPHSDFFSLKAGVMAGFGDGLRFTASSKDSRFHPTIQARIDGRGIQGVIGRIHPQLAEEIGIPESVVLAEGLIDPGQLGDDIQYQPISRLPAVRRDIAILVNLEVSYSQIEGVIKSVVGPLLESLWLFDVYTGKGIPEGKKSLGLALTLRPTERTFTDEQANQIRDDVVKELGSLGALQR